MHVKVLEERCAMATTVRQGSAGDATSPKYFWEIDCKIAETVTDIGAKDERTKLLFTHTVQKWVRAPTHSQRTLSVVL